MSLASVRSRIHTTLSDAVVLGAALSTQAQVHRYFRSVKSEQEIASKLKHATTSKLHAWMVSLDERAFTTTRSSRQQGRDPMREFGLYNFALYGYYAVDDAVASEETWSDIVEDVIDAFRADKKLNNTVVDSGPPQWVRGGGGEGCVLMPSGNGSVLCHFAKLALPVFEDLGA
jgi:hypothetical protein